MFQQWSYRILDIEAHVSDDNEPSDQAEGMVTETLTQLLKLGSYINRQPKVAMKNTMESLHDKVPELLPQQGRYSSVIYHNITVIMHTTTVGIKAVYYLLYTCA